MPPAAVVSAFQVVVSSYKPPKLPPVQKMPQRRQRPRISPAGRMLAAVAGLALITASGLGLWRAVSNASGPGNPVLPLALLLPAVILLRYAATGQIKPN